MAAATRPDARSPRFRRDPFVRDGVFDLGRATAPRMTAPHMLPSATLKASAPTTLLLTRLNSPPHTIAVYASPWSSPSRTQHSLPGGCYPLPGPDFHRLDRASFCPRRRRDGIISGFEKLRHWALQGLRVPVWMVTRCRHRAETDYRGGASDQNSTKIRESIQTLHSGLHIVRWCFGRGITNVPHARVKSSGREGAA